MDSRAVGVGCKSKEACSNEYDLVIRRQKDLKIPAIRKRSLNIKYTIIITQLNVTQLLCTEYHNIIS